MMTPDRQQRTADFWKGCRAFVTGATGFLGSHLVRRLLERGASIGVLLRSQSSTVRIHDLLGSLEVAYADLTEYQCIADSLKRFGPTHVFHLAAYGVDRPVGDPAPYVQVNMLGTAHLLEASRGLALATFAQTGTSAEYGGEGSPFAEHRLPAPISPYGASKAGATLFALMYHRLYALPVVIVRPFQVYGPGQKSRLLIPSVIRCALRGEDVALTPGEQVRDFVFVTDVIDGILLAAERPAAVGRMFNLGAGKGWKVRDVAAKILDLTASSAKLKLGALPYRGSEIADLRADTRQAREVLGWQAKVDLEEGLRRTIDWHRQFFEQESRLGEKSPTEEEAS